MVDTQIKDSTDCPHCMASASEYDEILRDFGLRNMDGTTRVQSWCRKCRSTSSAGVAA